MWHEPKTVLGRIMNNLKCLYWGAGMIEDK